MLRHSHAVELGRGCVGIGQRKVQTIAANIGWRCRPESAAGARRVRAPAYSRKDAVDKEEEPQILRRQGYTGQVDADERGLRSADGRFSGSPFC